MTIASRQRVSIAGPALRVDGSARRERGPEERSERGGEQ